MGLSGSNLARRAMLLAGIAVATIVAIVAGRIVRAYQDSFDIAARSEQRTVQLLQINADGIFRSIDIMLDRAIAEVNAYEDQDARGKSLTDRFVTIAQPWEFVYGLAYAEKDGVIRQVIHRDNGRETARDISIDHSHDEMFTAHRDGIIPRGKIFISAPYRGWVSNTWIIAVTKAVIGPDGQFRGTVFVTLSLDTFTRWFTGVIDEPVLGLALAKQDGAVLFTIPDHDQIGRSYSGTSLFRRIRAGVTSGVFRIVVDSAEHQVAFGVSQDYPLVIIFGVDSQSILQHWRHEAFALSGAAALGILMILALTWWLLRHIAAEERTQDVLRESERRLLESQRIAGIGHFERDLGAKHTRWADNMYELHGVTPEQYPDGRDAMAALVHPDERGSLRESFARMDEDAGKVGSSERRIIRPDGEVRIIRYEWRFVEGMEAGRARLFGVAQDLTAIRQAEAALRRNEQRLRDLLDCSSDFIWETNADGIMTLLAGQNGDLFSYALGRHGAEVEAIELESVGTDLPALREAIGQQQGFRNLVVPLRTVNGDVRWIRTSGKPLFEADGTFMGFRGAGADVTETLRQRQIDEHRRKAEALGRLASGIAHEINNLLQPIIIYATFGSGDEQANAGQKRYFTRIARAAEAATLIVRNVLSFARERPPQREAVSLAEAVRETLDLLGDALPNGVTRVMLPIDEDCIVDVDRSGLAQALTNLITNAAEAMSDGGVITTSARTVHLRTEEAQAAGVAPGAYCLLSVADTGNGIPPDQIDKVFDPFFTTKPQGRGTGLGLSVVAGHAKSWGGAATVTSVPSSGTVFTLYMPLARAQMVAAQ